MGATQQLRRIFHVPPRHILVAPGRNCWRVAASARSGLLIDGRDYYRAFFHAAERAEHYILLSGWQFDSNVALLRGADVESIAAPVQLLDYLNWLCERKPQLQVYLLAWDYSMLYSLDREWFQEWYFNWSTSDRLKFCFDRANAFDASHHQKFVVIDGTLAFVGGLDLCTSRWDESDHRADNPLRRDRNGKGYRTFHDMQSYHQGQLAQHLAEYFQRRWRAVCGDCLDLPRVDLVNKLPFEPTLELGPAQVAISRTEVNTLDGAKPTLEIRQLFIDAIDAAERLIYIENQYCSSEALADALVARMRRRRRPRLQIVAIIAKDAEALLEQLSIGLAQTRIIHRLRQIAEATGHALGIYYPASRDDLGTDVPTYIHSKLLLVDDRLLSMGSANMNNRSMGYDTELNVTWNDLPGSALSERIRCARAHLLAEHTGLQGAERACLENIDGLVDCLNRLADSGSSRLRHHPTGSISEEYQWLTSILPDGLPFDCEVALECSDRPKSRPSLLTRSLATLQRLFGSPQNAAVERAKN